MTRERFDAVLFDLDGVVTDTARIHAVCWKRASIPCSNGPCVAFGEALLVSPATGYGAAVADNIKAECGLPQSQTRVLQPEPFASSRSASVRCCTIRVAVTISGRTT